MNKINKYLPISLVVLSVAGFIDALYLSYARYMHVDLPCSITNGGCSIVAASPYAVMFGVPLAYWGVLYYLLIIILSIIYTKNIFSRKSISKYLLTVTSFGATSSVYFLYLQGFVINAFCIYCITSAMISFVLLAIVIYMFIKNVDLIIDKDTHLDKFD